jgi:prepilin-type N-terminal cleavage/methylation domain-containing protein
MSFPRPSARRLRVGFSLLEVLVVLAILAVLSALTTVAVFRLRASGERRLDRSNWLAMRSLGKSARRTTPIRVLWIGNSYTYVNNLPGMVAALVQAGGNSPAYAWDMQTVGGATLQMHWDQGIAVQKIRQGDWDFVVLQEQSQMAILDEATYDKYVRLFNGEIRKVNAIPLLFMTWAHQPQSNLQPLYNRAFLRIAQEVRAEASPVGVAWARCLQTNPQLNLFASDGSHPSPTGTYLAACVFFGALFDRGPAGLPGTLTVDGQVAVSLAPADAASIQAIAWQAVLDIRKQLQPDNSVARLAPWSAQPDEASLPALPPWHRPDCPPRRKSVPCARLAQGVFMPGAVPLGRGGGSGSPTGGAAGVATSGAIDAWMACTCRCTRYPSSAGDVT